MAGEEQAGSVKVSAKLSQGASQALTPSSTVPQKRKGSPQVKFYAVRIGYTPGIYLSWKECERNIVGFKNAAFKSFLSREDADAYVAGREISLKPTQPASHVEKFYGVAKGRVPGVYTNWDIAQKQITGWKYPKYKKFATKAEAEEFVRSNGNISVYSTPLISSKDVSKKDPMPDSRVVEDDMSEVRGVKRIKTAAVSHQSSATLGYDVMAGIDKDVLDPVDPTDSTEANQTAVLRIYTDGSSLSNGQNGARAGLGVYFGPRDSRNVAERLPGEPQTNQRAELAAILRALDISPTNREVHIITDSRYSINCVTVWCKNWEKNSWQTSQKQPVLNKDLIQGVLAKIRNREALGAATRFFWIKGHSDDPGNEAADKLAVLGAQKPGVG